MPSCSGDNFMSVEAYKFSSRCINLGNTSMPTRFIVGLSAYSGPSFMSMKYDCSAKRPTFFISPDCTTNLTHPGEQFSMAGATGSFGRQATTECSALPSYWYDGYYKYPWYSITTSECYTGDTAPSYIYSGKSASPHILRSSQTKQCGFPKANEKLAWQRGACSGDGTHPVQVLFSTVLSTPIMAAFVAFRLVPGPCVAAA